jgi:DnaK suppressor protein
VTDRARLEEERGVVLRRIAALRGEHDDFVAASRDTNADDEHDPEGATIAFERSQVGALVRQARERLAELDAAGQRVADGTYGVCEMCGRPIAAGRLAARPEARTCIACAGRRRQS